MKALFYIQLIFTIIILSGCEKGGNIDVEAEILKEMSTAQIPSVVACVISNNEIVWEGIYGFADISESRLTTRQTSYTLMSISKLFLATAVMQLWERGRINLDEDINQYLPFEVKNPKFPNQKITARMLLIHTSSMMKFLLLANGYLSTYSLVALFTGLQYGRIFLPGSRSYIQI